MGLSVEGAVAVRKITSKSMYVYIGDNTIGYLTGSPPRIINVIRRVAPSGRY